MRERAASHSEQLRRHTYRAMIARAVAARHDAAHAIQVLVQRESLADRAALAAEIGKWEVEREAVLGLGQTGAVERPHVRQMLAARRSSRSRPGMNKLMREQ